jgi:hypothetical protein
VNAAAIQEIPVRYAIGWSLIFWSLFAGAVFAAQPWSAVCWWLAVAQVVGTAVWMLKASK